MREIHAPLGIIWKRALRGMDTMNGHAYRIKLCWGLESGQCPNLVDQAEGLKDHVQSVLDRSGWPQCLAERLQRKVKPLDQFSVSVSGCPNGCSRPQIADFGLLMAERPRVDVDVCTGCGACAQVCREGAVRILGEKACIDTETCLSCGACARSCPEQALSPEQQGFRVQVGGKLGRHPQLARELAGIRGAGEMLGILNACLGLHQEHYRPGVRFGQVMREQGMASIEGGAYEMSGTRQQELEG